MQEKQVTVGRTMYELPRLFFVIATQNPIEQEGTCSLPEAQLDRFMFNIHVDYPQLPEEEKILASTTTGESPEIKKVLGAKDILAIQAIVEKVAVANYLISYVARLVRATWPKSPEAPEFIKKLLEWGAGPRAGQYLILGAKAMAAMDGRANISTEDIRRLAVPVLRHRILPNFQAQAEGIDSVDIIKKLVQTIEEPRVAKYA